MSVIARPRWTRQPQGAIKIDWSHPLTRRLVSCLELRGTRVQDLASSLVFNHTRPIVGTEKGLAPSFTGTALINTGVTSLGGQSLFATSGNPFTVSLLVKRTASNTYFAKASATSANRTFQIGEGGGAGDATPFVGIRGTFTNTNLGYSDSNWHLYTVVFDGTSATLFVDSTKSAALTVGTAAEETTENVTIGGRTASSPGSLFPGNVAFVRVWSRALAQREHIQLWSNPWQIFVPQREVIYSTVGAANVDATIAPTQAVDTAALGATVTNRASLAPQQAADVAALGATVTNRIALTPQQAPDAVAVNATVTNRVQLAPTQAADTAAINVIAGSLSVAIAATQLPDSAAIVVQLPSGTGAGASRRGKRRRIVLGDQVYDVLERDLPTLLEAVLLNRKPPATAVVEPAQATAPDEPVQAPAMTMRAALPSLDEARERYEAMLADVNRAATADVAALLQRVANRVLAELEDDEDAAVTLLLH